MRSLKRQAGASFLQIIFIVAGIGFVATCTVKMAPIYLEAWTIKDIIEKGFENGDINGNMAPKEVRAAIGRYMTANRIESLSSRDLIIKRNRKEAKLTIDARYESRIELVGNVDVVLKFDDLLFEFAATGRVD